MTQGRQPLVAFRNLPDFELPEYQSTASNGLGGLLHCVVEAAVYLVLLALYTAWWLLRGAGRYLFDSADTATAWLWYWWANGKSAVPGGWLYYWWSNRRTLPPNNPEGH